METRIDTKRRSGNPEHSNNVFLDPTGSVSSFIEYRDNVFLDPRDSTALEPRNTPRNSTFLDPRDSIYLDTRDSNLPAPRESVYLDPYSNYLKRTDSRLYGSRSRSLSNVSCMSSSTWWSAAASVSNMSVDVPEFTDCEENKPGRKVDSGFSLEGVQERRESIATSRGSHRSTCSLQITQTEIHQIETQQEARYIKLKDIVMPKEKNIKPATECGELESSDRPPRLSRQTTHSSSVTMVNPRRRPSTSAGLPSPCSMDTTLRGTSTRPSSSALRSPSSPYSPPTSSCGQWPQSSWDSAEAITEARRRKRREIAESLIQKYPNDRCHGEFLPFNTAFSHSSDSLAPVRFTPPASASSCPPSTAGTAFDDPQALMDPSTIAWKNMDSLRAEYAAVDRRKRSPWQWIRQRILCGGTALGCGNKNEFWEDGDDDKGSVRRYRLELPDRGDDSAAKMPVRVRSVGRQTTPVEPPMARSKSEEHVKERWSTVGILEGIRIDTSFEGLRLPEEGFRDEEANSPMIENGVREGSF